MAILTLKGLFPCYHGDVTQLMNSRYCVIMLVVLAFSHVFLVSVYHMTPIRCFCPSHMMDVQCDMLSKMCLSPETSNTIIPEEDEESVEQLVVGPYYQFACLVFLLQASMFFVPSVISRELSRWMGVQTSELSLTALEARRSREVDDRNGCIHDLATHIHVYCVRQLRQRRASIAFKWLYGMRLTLLQIFTRLLYVANVIGQFYLLDYMLGFNFHELGWPIVGRSSIMSSSLSSINLANYLLNILTTLDYNDNSTSLDENVDEFLQAEIPHKSFFPQEFYCDCSIRQLGSLHRYSLHCLLPLNSLNRVLFHYVWFLLLGIAIVSCSALFLSVFKLLTYPCHRLEIRERLLDIGKKIDQISNEHAAFEELRPNTGEEVTQQPATEMEHMSDRYEDDDESNAEIPQNNDSKIFDIFEREFLCLDGVLLLDYIKSGGGDVICDSTLSSLWEMYRDDADLSILLRPMQRKEKIIEDIYHTPVLNLERSDSPPMEMFYRPPGGDTEALGNNGDRPPDYFTTMEGEDENVVSRKRDDDVMV